MRVSHLTLARSALAGLFLWGCARIAPFTFVTTAAADRVRAQQGVGLDALSQWLRYAALQIPRAGC
jgi:hypothetical protein